MNYIDTIKLIALPTKYTKWYIAIVLKALARSANTEKYMEKHHILPKSFGLGGEVDANNLVQLTAREHYIVHCCLVKMFVGSKLAKMIYALNRMNHKNKFQHRGAHNARTYERAKIAYAKMYKKYVYKGTSKKLAYEDTLEALIQAGWSTTMPHEYKKGRVGNMRGKKHSAETKAKFKKIRKTQQHLPRARTAIERQQVSIKLKGLKRTNDQKLAQSTRMTREYAEGIKPRPTGNKNPMYGKKRKACYNPLTRESRYIDITESTVELNQLLDSGWKLGLLRKC